MERPVPDFGSDLDLEAFRAEARAWLEANFPASLKGRGAEAMAEDGAEPDTAAAGFRAPRPACCSRRWGARAPSTR
jgi:hypothetical protein